MDPYYEEKEKRKTKTQSTFLKLFDCPVCFERIAPPVTVCINGHAVCSDCKKHLLTCPTCKANFSHYKNTMIDQIIEENMYLCKYSERGCNVELKFREIEMHEKKHCQHRTLKCELQKDDLRCGDEIPIWDYHIHVLRNHPQETINFRVETHRTINICEKFPRTNILKNITTHKIIFETVKYDLDTRKFYIAYQYIGLFDDSVFTLRFYNRTNKHKEILFKNMCAPIGLSEEDFETSDKCLIIDTNLINSFITDDQITYSIQINPLPRKWFDVLKDKCKFKSINILQHSSRSSSSQC